MPLVAYKAFDAPRSVETVAYTFIYIDICIDR